MATDYNKLIKDNFVRLVVLMVLAIIMGIVIVGLSTDRHINLWVVEFNADKKDIQKTPDTALMTKNVKPDTVYIASKQDRLPKNFPILGLEKKTTSKKADTVAKQQATVTGDNAHVISGNNNKVDVNGDVNISQQPELNEWYRAFFIRHIDQVKKDSSITSNKIIIHMGNGSNAGKLASQLRTYLEGKGYEVSSATTFESFTGIGVAAGIYFDNTTKAVDIYIGNISQ